MPEYQIIHVQISVRVYQQVMYCIDSLHDCTAASATCNFTSTSFLHTNSSQHFLTCSWQLFILLIMHCQLFSSGCVGGWGYCCWMKKWDSWFPLCWSTGLDFKTGCQETHLRSVGPPITWLSLSYCFALLITDIETQSTDCLNIPQIIWILKEYVKLTAVTKRYCLVK